MGDTTLIAAYVVVTMQVFVFWGVLTLWKLLNNKIMRVDAVLSKLLENLGYPKVEREP